MEEIKTAFDAIATEYDAQREYIIPEMRLFYSTAVWAAEIQDVNPAILDIGAGTGMLSALMLEKFPEARLYLMDISEKMLEMARQRFNSRKNIQFIVSDYSSSELGGPYDLIYSALSIHHLPSKHKCLLFKRINAALKPGCLFVNADQADGASPYFRQRYMEYWNDFLLSGPICEAQLMEILKRRDNFDRNDKILDQLCWLQDAGFSDVDVVFKNRTFIVTVARKV